MALTSFALSNYIVNHSVDYPDIVCVEQNDSMLVVLADHPVSGQKYISQLALTPANSSHTTYASIWANAVNVAYNPTLDQITGTLYTPDTSEPEGEGFIPRSFCMSLQGTPDSRKHHLHVYVSASLNGGGGDPDDGSWTGDTPQ